MLLVFVCEGPVVHAGQKVLNGVLQQGSNRLARSVASGVGGASFLGGESRRLI